MEIIKGLDFKIKNSAVSLGKFDGFHRGHRLLLDRILEHPELHATVFTFDGILKGKQIYPGDAGGTDGRKADLRRRGFPLWKGTAGRCGYAVRVCATVWL